MTSTALFLRESTTEAHRHAETRPLNRALARGEITLEQWRSSLEQHLLVYRALDHRLDRIQQTHPAWTAAFAEPFRRRAPDYAADLADLNGSPDPQPLPATEAAVQAIGHASPEAIIGMLYVSEGSTNGGRFLVRGATRALGIDPSSRTGVRHLDPYGDLQPARWAAFKAGLDAMEFTEAERDQIRSGAEAMFQWVGAIADEVWSVTGPKPVG
jgi:heme oxygenase